MYYTGISDIRLLFIVILFASFIQSFLLLLVSPLLRQNYSDFAQPIFFSLFVGYFQDLFATFTLHK